ncbi:hypothetical protein ACFE04_021908 [Oxalis oulophora]
MSGTLAEILGGVGGAVLLLGIVALLIWFCLFHKNTTTRTSDSESSDQSFQEGRHQAVELSLREARRFEIGELFLATKNFGEKNLIGQGNFGEVYKGLLHDGILVAIKKRSGAPSLEFVDEVRYLSAIQHRNIVSLLGYCQESNLQCLVYEYIPNGSVSSHLYGGGPVPHEKLEFKHRLAIALGAAKGLAHLHSLSPRLIHKDFKTANVLVDENFISKVADSGLRNFLGKFDVAGPSSQVASDEIFLAPEVREFRRFSEKSDAYSFGVFLLELVSGREASESPPTGSGQNLVEWVQSIQEMTNIYGIIDQRLANNFTAEGMKEFVRLIVRCMEPSSERRPAMSFVVMELDRILEKEMTLTTVMGEGTPIVTLGNWLAKQGILRLYWKIIQVCRVVLNFGLEKKNSESDGEVDALANSGTNRAEDFIACVNFLFVVVDCGPQNASFFDMAQTTFFGSFEGVALKGVGLQFFRKYPSLSDQQQNPTCDFIAAVVDLCMVEIIETCNLFRQSISYCGQHRILRRAAEATD